MKPADAEMTGNGAIVGDDCALKIREHLARRRMTRQQLAHDAKLSLSTLEKALSGRRPFTLATIVRLEQVLGVELRPRGPSNPGTGQMGVAGDEHGGYARNAVSWLEGDYLTLRHSFSDKSAVFAYRTSIKWDDSANVLKFRESERLDTEFAQFGEVTVPHYSGHIYLVTNRHGQYRLVVLSRPTHKGEMHGILTTLQAGRGSQLTPTATPIVLVAMKELQPSQSVAFGRISAGHTCFPRYHAVLQRTLDEPFAIFPHAKAT